MVAKSNKQLEKELNELNKIVVDLTKIVYKNNRDMKNIFGISECYSYNKQNDGVPIISKSWNVDGVDLTSDIINVLNNKINLLAESVGKKYQKSEITKPFFRDSDVEKCDKGE